MKIVIDTNVVAWAVTFRGMKNVAKESETMKRILVAFLIVTLFYPFSAFGEIQIITHSVKQSFGGSQSPDDARIAAVAKAKREALELAGTYVESTTVVKNARVAKDEILALAAGVLKAEVVSQKNYTTGDAFGIEVTVRVAVDTSVLEVRLKKVLDDRSHLAELTQARAREKELLEKISSLEGENRKSGKSKQKLATLKKEFAVSSQGLTAIEWFDKALALWADGKFSDLQKAIEYSQKAIQLKPDYADAYNYRGSTYMDLGQLQSAIQDYDTAIRIKPDLAKAYSNRGNAYAKLGQVQKAIEDYDAAIRLIPDGAMFYGNRGLAYGRLGQHQQAIQDYDTAIRLKPDFAMAYGYRGYAYADLGQYQRAIQDYDTLIRLKPDDANTYANRGFAYSALKQYQRAIQDYDTAIRLKPDDANTYANRGLAYSVLKQYQRAIQDYDTLIHLKPDDVMAYMAYIVRGGTYYSLKQYQRAIQDYDTAIRLKPDDAAAYISRGLAYISSGNSQEGCRSLNRACELGDCISYESEKRTGSCR